MISVKFVYNDGKDLNVTIPDEDLNKFFGNLNQGQPYWDKNIKNGFWTNMGDVRFIQFMVHDEEKNESQQEEACDSACGRAPCEGACPREIAGGDESAAGSSE